MNAEKKIRHSMKDLSAALQKMHARALGDTSKVYMSIPADPSRDADLMLADALEELAALRAQVERPFACGTCGVALEFNRWGQVAHLCPGAAAGVR